MINAIVAKARRLWYDLIAVKIKHKEFIAKGALAAAGLTGLVGIERAGIAGVHQSLTASESEQFATADRTRANHERLEAEGLLAGALAMGGTVYYAMKRQSRPGEQASTAFVGPVEAVPAQPALPPNDERFASITRIHPEIVPPPDHNVPGRRTGAA